MSVIFISFGISEVKNLQVDTGFSGWFLIDWETYKRLELKRAELPKEFWPEAKGFGGGRKLRGGYLEVKIPELDFSDAHIAYSAPGLGREWNLVGLRFLDQFKWSGNGEVFCLRGKKEGFA
ncbi:MAG: hypothetical protein ACE5OR_14025 [bacterium]